MDSLGAPAPIARSPLVTQLEKDYNYTILHINLRGMFFGAMGAIGSLAVGTLAWKGWIRLEGITSRSVVGAVGVIGLGLLYKELERKYELDLTPDKIRVFEALEALLEYRFRQGLKNDQLTIELLKAELLVTKFALLAAIVQKSVVFSRIEKLVEALGEAFNKEDSVEDEKFSQINRILDEPQVLLDEWVEEVIYQKGKIVHLEQARNPTITSLQTEINGIGKIKKIWQFIYQTLGGLLLEGFALTTFWDKSFIPLHLKNDRVQQFACAILSFAAFLSGNVLLYKWYSYQKKLNKTAEALAVMQGLPQNPESVKTLKDAEEALGKFVLAIPLLLELQKNANQALLEKLRQKSEFLDSPKMAEDIKRGLRDDCFIGRVQDLTRLYLQEQIVLLKILRFNCQFQSFGT